MSRRLERLAIGKNDASAGHTIYTVPAGQKVELREARITNTFAAGTARIILYVAHTLGNVYLENRQAVSGLTTITLVLNTVLYAGDGIGIGIQAPSTMDYVISGIVLIPA